MTDRDLFRRYDLETMKHCNRVADAVPRDLRRVAAFHDWLEEGLGTVEELRAAGLGTKELRLLKLLTRQPGEVYMDYIRRLSEDPDATKIKLADIADNLSRPQPKGSLRQRYETAKKYLEKVQEGGCN